MRSSKPKVLHEFAGKTFLQRVMASVGHLEPETLAVVVHYQADRVSEAARSYDANVDIVNQDDIPGTGRAVQCAMAQLTQERNLHGSVLIAASDMPLLDSVTLKKLVAFHEQSGDGATVLTTILDNPTGYGRIIRDRDGHVLRIVEQKDANRSRTRGAGGEHVRVRVRRRSACRGHREPRQPQRAGRVLSHRRAGDREDARHGSGRSPRPTR